jgi:hypothetical protein
MSRLHLRGPAVVALAAAALALSGCGGSTGHVKGKITVNGEPVKRGLIVFLPQSGNRDPFNTAIIDGTYDTVAMPVGPAKIYVTALDPMSAAPPADQGDLTAPPKAPPAGKRFTAVPAKYQSPDTSDLQFDVKPGISTYDIDLK